MKSIITFSLALLATFGSNAANRPEITNPEIKTGEFASQNKFSNEEFVAHPSVFISTNFSRSVEAVVSDNQEIVETVQEPVLPLFFETSVNVIKEGNRITEASFVDYAPLDFKIINKKQVTTTLPAMLPKL